MAVSAGGRYWRSAAACRSCDPDLFFPVSSSDAGLEQVARAKAVCARCPVSRECLAFALRTRQAYGVWGGMSEQERYLVWRHGERGTDPGAGEGHLHRMSADEQPALENLAEQC